MRSRTPYDARGTCSPKTIKKMPRGGGEYPGISFRYGLLTTSHLSNFTLRAPHALQARNSILSGHEPPDRRRTFGPEASKVPWLEGAKGSLSSQHPQTCFLPSSDVGDIRRCSPSFLVASATGSVPAITQHYTRRVTVSSTQNL
jgi:hypothetical protein